MSVLITPQILATESTTCVVVDCRHDLGDPEAGNRAYLSGHIPGAVFAHLDSDLSGPKTGRNGRHPLPTVEALTAWLGRMGITPQTRVVAYDASGGMFAARLWWLLRWLGHEHVAVLDGGWQAWLEAGLPASIEVPEPTAAVYNARPRGDLAVGMAQIRANLDAPAFLVVDARSPDRFRGLGETIDPVGGHIPGAANRFFQHNLDAGGRFKSAGTLRNEWREVIGSRSPADIVCQCGSGVTACHNLLALELAGLSGARLYAGSWSEWCAHPDNPVAR
ncbi:sulfurtransferase [Jeongeupia chitinilytica]|uniref:Sulfurtransferase n=1 Tax=Jeongeupia chitinilytica TaxID=1041641 RepID=A0ABQ3H011_9NEIS|nr:sulfurtransferase [Jeongeupia chitinilytica]GHD63623.1 sulfurtransferase [Jeongeupia chitinilytica]